MLFIVDVKAATHGVLTVGGLVAMTIGSIMLFNDPDPALHASLQVIIPVVLVTGAFFVVGVYLSIRSLRRKPTTGGDALVGQEGDARTPIDAERAAGFSWPARTGPPFPTRRSRRESASG